MAAKQADSKVELLALGVARGLSMRRAADHAGVAETTARRWASQPTFQPMVRKLREDMIAQAVGRLSYLGDAAAVTLGKLLADPESEIRYKAARAILADLLSVRDHAEFSARLDALEGRKHGTNQLGTARRA